MLLVALGGTRPVSATWAKDSVATIKPSANVDSNMMVFMTCVLLKGCYNGNLGPERIAAV
jgi:hypothetical protein